MEQGKFVEAFFEQKLFVIFEILVKEYQSDRSCRIGKFMFLVMFFVVFLEFACLKISEKTTVLLLIYTNQYWGPHLSGYTIH